MKTERIWLASYPATVPADIDTHQISSLDKLLEQCFTSYANRTAESFMGKKYSYARIDALSTRIASYLQSLGLAKGDRVAVMMPNVPQYPVVATAILRAGFVLVNVNPMYTASELEHQLIDADARAIFIIENFAHTLAEIAGNVPVKHIIITAAGDLLGPIKGWLVNRSLHAKGQIPAYNLPQATRFKNALAHGEQALPSYRRPMISPEDIAVLQYTGGTTGVSKGAALRHRNLIANVLQIHAWILPALQSTLANNNQIVLVGALPLYHVFAFTVNLLISFYLGAHNILIANPRDINALLRDLRRQPFHVFPAVNTMFNAILNHPQAQSMDWSSLRLSVGGGMAVQQATAQAWHQLTGCCIMEGYGMSETSPVICVGRADLTSPEQFRQGIGYPVPSTEVILIDDNDHPVPIGSPGEITVRGPQVMAGYWNAPEETAKIMTASGFLRTGDIGIMDETGWIRIVDRKKDMILVSGFNVYPNEVEDVVSLMDGVQECVAIGVPDKHSGEAVMVLIVKKNPELTEADVKAWCHDRLTGYKRPRHVVFRESLPKSAVGKFLRKEVRALLASEQSSTHSETS